MLEVRRGCWHMPTMKESSVDQWGVKPQRHPNSQVSNKIINIKGTVYLRRWIRERRPFWRLFHPKCVTGNKMENVNTTNRGTEPCRAYRADQAIASAEYLPRPPACLHPSDTNRNTSTQLLPPRERLIKLEILKEMAFWRADPEKRS